MVSGQIRGDGPNLKAQTETKLVSGDGVRVPGHPHPIASARVSISYKPLSTLASTPLPTNTSS